MDFEQWIRLGLFVGVFTLLAVFEAWKPWRGISQRPLRWLKHFCVIAVGNGLIRIIFSTGAAVAASVWANAEGVGLFQWLKSYVWVPLWVVIPVCVLALDGVIYWQHRLFHKVPWLWYLHKFHHQDTQLDVSSALRFHPVEMVLSMAIKIGAVVALGAPVMAVFIFEVLLNGVSMFNHADIRLPAKWERRLRLLIVTPDMHRVHHNMAGSDMNRNFGFNFSWWDRWFKSYQADHSGESLAFGVPERKS